MKKLFGILVSLCASIICLTGVSAKEINLNDKVYNNSYIIGNRIFQLNKYVVTAYDLVKATDEYNQFIGGGTPIYYVNGGYIYEVTEAGFDSEGIKVSELEGNGIVDVWGINNGELDYIPEEVQIPYDENKVNSKINSVVKNLNAGSSEYGIDEIEYNDEDNTLTFNVSDGEKPISDYAKSGIVDFLKAFVSDEFGAQSVSINGKDYGDVTDLTEANIVGLAATAIKDIIGEADEILSSLEGQNITVSVIYSDGTKVDYKVSFVANN